MRTCKDIVAKAVLILLLGAMTAGCANTLAFGTATKFGLDISQRADQMVEVSLGYDRVEVASIPAPQADPSENEDTYAVLGIFDVKYGNPWKLEPLVLNQFFATGWAARRAAQDPRFQEFFGRRAGEITGQGEDGIGGKRP